MLSSAVVSAPNCKQSKTPLIRSLCNGRENKKQKTRHNQIASTILSLVMKIKMKQIAEHHASSGRLVARLHALDEISRQKCSRVCARRSHQLNVRLIPRDLMRAAGRLERVEAIICAQCERATRRLERGLKARPLRLALKRFAEQRARHRRRRLKEVGGKLAGRARRARLVYFGGNLHQPPANSKQKTCGINAASVRLASPVATKNVELFLSRKYSRARTRL